MPCAGSAVMGRIYSSAIPEPYTFIPKEQRTIALADGSITSPFLAMFGRSSRDTGMEAERDNHPSAAQSLYLLNSTDIQRRIGRSPLLRSVVMSTRGNRTATIRRIYLILLSRFPTPGEITVAQEYFQTAGLQVGQAANDLAWALINSKEFLYRH